MENKILFEKFVENLYRLYSAPSMRKCFEFAQGENRVLLTLSMTNNKGLSPTELTEELNVTKQRVTNILTSLKKKDFINLEMDMEDRRKTIVTLTKEGERYINQKGNEVDNEIKVVVKKLGKEKTEKLTELIEEINNLLE